MRTSYSMVLAVCPIFLLLSGCESCTVTKPLDFKQVVDAGGMLSATSDSDRCTATTTVSVDDPTKLNIKLSCGITISGPDLSAIGGGPTVFLAVTSGGRSTHDILPGFQLKNGYTVASVSWVTARDASVRGGDSSTLPPSGGNSPACTVRLWVDAMPDLRVGQGVQKAENGGSLRITIRGPAGKDPFRE